MNGQGIKALLADDESVFRVATARLLHLSHIECDTAVNGDEAAHRLDHACYDVLVAEIKMPGLDGFALLKHAASSNARPAVIFVTGYPSLDTAIESLDQGAFAYKVKPFDIKDFIDTVNSAGRFARLRRRIDTRRDETRQSLTHLEDLSATLDGLKAKRLDETAQDYLLSLITDIVRSSLEASEILDCMNRHHTHAPLRHLSRKPEADMLRNAVQETINVLEKTKTTFKSKELATLRRKLNTLIDITGNTGP